jgi:Kef-type K+ transport system membrane component KefB/mannitol/fructose-specific phosphotransferase system IIA component (Ntr-type)
MSSSEVALLLLGLAVLLAAARALGELFRRFEQPAILGEILAGVLLGPTVLGRVWPEFGLRLFPAEGPLALASSGISIVAITLFLLVAGMEVDLSTVWRQGRSAVSVAALGIAVPFAIGYVPAFVAPELLGHEGQTSVVVFALFFATALSISALPVIARTLMDLDLYRTEFGMLIIGAAVLNDLIGWTIFAVVLGMIEGEHGGGHGHSIGETLAMTMLFVVGVLTVGRWLLHRSIPFVERHSRQGGGVMSFAFILALSCAALTEWIGVHAIFGSFIFGVALGDSSNLREQTRATLERFISLFFAPIFFAGIGSRIDFASHFDWALTLIVIAIACVGKLLGCGLGARLGGVSPRESWAVGFGMNARGAMEIILGLLALEAGVIGQRLFVALVVMAIFTSMLGGPAIKAILRRRGEARRFVDLASRRTFVAPLVAADRFEAIAKLVELAAQEREFDPRTAAEAVAERERIQGTGLPNAVAIPHARLEGLSRPVVAIGVSHDGLDFDAADGVRARLVVLVLTPKKDGRAQLEVLSDIARTFETEELTLSAAAAATFDEFERRVRAMRR